MSMAREIRLREAREDDLPVLLDIYNDAVSTSSATFDLEEQTLDERRGWFGAHDGRHPLIAAETDGKVIGYCSLSPFREKPGYSKSVELSVYVQKDFRRMGIATALMREVVSRAKELGYHTIISGIAGSNDASVELHKRLGFESMGYLRQVGFKFNQWQDLHFFQLVL